MDQVLFSSPDSNFVDHQLPQAIRSAISLTHLHKRVLPAELRNGKSARRIVKCLKTSMDRICKDSSSLRRS